MAVGERHGAKGRDEEGRHGFRYVLAQPAFRLIWFAQVLGQLADKFLMFSLIILAYHVSGGSTPVAFTLLAYTVPAVVIAPLAGVFADRFDRKLIMVATNLARAVLIALIPIASLVPGLRGDFLHLLVITFLFSAVGQLFSPAEAAAIPTVLPKRALLSANSLVLITMVTTLVLGGVAAPLVSRYDIYSPYWLAVTLFAAAGILILLAPIPRGERFAKTDRHPFAQLAVELRDGMAALRSSPVVLLSFYELSLTVLVMFMMFTLAPAYVSRVIRITEQDSYVILLPATIGALSSALLLGQFGRGLNKAWLLVGGLVTTGLTLIALASVPQLIGHAPELRGYVRAFGARPGPRLRDALHGHQRRDRGARAPGGGACRHLRYRPRDRRAGRCAGAHRDRCCRACAARLRSSQRPSTAASTTTSPPQPRYVTTRSTRPKLAPR